MTFDERFWVSIAVLGTALIYDVLSYLVPTKLDPSLVALIIGVLNSVGVVGVVSYWLGSSKGSQDKDATIQHLSSKP